MSSFLLRIERLEADRDAAYAAYLSLPGLSAKEALAAGEAYNAYIHAAHLYRVAIDSATPLLLAAVQSLAAITPSTPCWECGTYNACPSDCRHGLARAILSTLDALPLLSTL